MTLSEAEALFELGEGYTLSEVRAARNRLARRYHPDVNDDARASESMMRKVNEAYRLLLRAAGDGRGEGRPGRDAGRERSGWEWGDELERRRREAEREERRRAEEARRARREAERRAREREALERGYQTACEAGVRAGTSAEHYHVASLFAALGSYRDSADQSAFHKGIADEMRSAELARQAMVRRINRLASVSMTVAPIAFLAMEYAHADPFLFLCLYFGAWIAPLMGIISFGLREETEYASGMIAVSFAVFGVLFVSFPGRSYDLASQRAMLLLAAAQGLSGASCIVGAGTKPRMLAKALLALLSFAALAAAAVVAFGGVAP